MSFLAQLGLNLILRSVSVVKFSIQAFVGQLVSNSEAIQQGQLLDVTYLSHIEPLSSETLIRNVMA